MHTYHTQVNCVATFHITSNNGVNFRPIVFEIEKLRLYIDNNANCVKYLCVFVKFLSSTSFNANFSHIFHLSCHKSATYNYLFYATKLYLRIQGVKRNVYNLKLWFQTWIIVLSTWFFISTYFLVGTFVIFKKMR